jgi:3-oxoacyl-[acyl-carrier-protein] synthase II
MNRRVVITGMGAVTPLGNDVKTTWKGIMAAKTGIAKVTQFDASSFPSQIAGEVKGLDFSPWIDKDKSLDQTMSNSRFALFACDESVKDSGLDWENLNRKRVGLYFAAGDSGEDVDPLAVAFSKSFNGSNEFSLPAYVREAIANKKAYGDVEQEPYMTLRHLIRHFKIEGPAYNCLTACAASAQAVGEASEMIRRGRTDVVLSGGSHSMIHPFGMAGFCLLTTLSLENDHPEKASRPFDLRRNGFVLSEGAGAVILEEYEHAKRRGANIYGELVGYGSTADAYRLTDSHPEGLGAVEAMNQAFQVAGMNPSQIDYINAHGTSTKVNDMVESLAVKKTFKGQAYKVPISSTKSMTGHLIAAAGVTELQYCLLAMRDSCIPPTINYRETDPDCDLDYVPNEPRQKKVRSAMSNSFGFGGQNIVLIVNRV